MFEVECSRDVEYGKAMGYWCSMVGNEGENYGKIVKQGLKQTLRQRMLTLTMDVYQPKDRPERKLMREEGRAERRPLVMFLHGGAFYVEDFSRKAAVPVEPKKDLTVSRSPFEQAIGTAGQFSSA